MMLSITYFTNEQIEIGGKQWKDTIFKINNYCLVILKAPPVFVSKISNPATSVINYKYFIPGIVIDKHLGIWIKNYNIERENILIGNFYNIKIVAKIDFIPKKELIHIFPDKVYDTLIGGIATDLIPGVMGPLYSMTDIKLKNVGEWKKEYRSSDIKKIYCPNSQKVQELPPGKHFFVIGPFLYELDKPELMPIKVSNDILNIHMEYAFYLQTSHDINKMIKMGYVKTDIDTKKLYTREGLTYEVPRRIIFKSKKMVYETP